MIDGYDAWKLASPPEMVEGPDFCFDCQGELDARELAGGICRPCRDLRNEDDQS